MRKDRNRCGGGAVLFIKDHLSFTNWSDLVPPTLEMICIELHLPHSKSFLVSTWYRPPNSDIKTFDDYESFLDKCDLENKELIIVGDYNCDMSKPSEIRNYDCYLSAFMGHLKINNNPSPSHFIFQQ